MSTNKKSSNIINPHSVFSNGENVDISELLFFVDLKVIKRNRLYKGNSSDESVSISFLGNKTPKSDFTTLFTENEENFGIKSIDYKISSSYVPQVDIVFEDVRGQSLFNNYESSKYKILFDFPPPIFILTIKGYYGQAVENRLHLLKCNTSINANGSYVIKCNFVGMTFAPLADIPFDYLLVAPYLNNEGKNIDEKTNTTLELRSRGTDLVSKIKSATSEEDRIIIEKTDKEGILEPYIQPDFISKFATTLETKGIRVTLLDKTIVKVQGQWFGTAKQYYSSNDSDSKDIHETLTNVIKGVLEELKDIKDNPIHAMVSYEELPEQINGIDGSYFTIYEVNLSTLAEKVRVVLNENAKEWNDKKLLKNQKVNEVVFKEIPGGPTLNNILDILLKDALSFYTTLKTVVENAEQRTSNKSTGEDQKYAFPKYFGLEDNGSNQSRKVLSLPPNNWVEVEFVDKYIAAKILAESEIRKQENNVFDVGDLADNRFLPINPFEAINRTQGKPYSNIHDLTELKQKIVQRAGVILNMTLAKGQGSDYTNQSKLINLYAKGEAYNIIEALKENKILLNSLITESNVPTFEFPEIILDSYRIDNASTGLSYGTLPMMGIFTAEQFNSGIPKIREPITGTDNLSKNLREIQNVYEDWSGVDLLEYNVPFTIDQKLKDSAGKLSDYYKPFTTGSDIFSTIDKVFNFEQDALKYLEYICEKKVGVTDNGVRNFREMNRFKHTAGIHEVPFFVLAWWGYKIKRIEEEVFENSNYKKEDWVSLPLGLKDELKKEYILYLELYETHHETLKGVNKTYVKGKYNSEFYEQYFIKEFLKPKYLILGYALPFNTPLNLDLGNKEGLNQYFRTFKSELQLNKQDIADEAKIEKISLKKITEDPILRSSLYYGFKTFVDRWIVGSGSLSIPDLFNLKSSFLMVDRAFNNIGDKVMLDLSPITNITTTDTSLYTVILNLLSKNNFEFFALPSYLDYSKNTTNGGIGWTNQNIDKIFGTHNDIPQKSNPKFICMYVGGTSSQLDMPKISEDSTSFDDDSGSVGEIEDIANNSNVHGFEIDFGTVNQSFFTNVELDQAEFKETNESINMLDAIVKNGGAQGEGNTVTKGNNMINVYEQRSYTCTVQALGNMMIQPTMYFDLVNINMWKGAYLILETSHHIEPNHMTTTFKGVRVPKYSKPYVTDFSLLIDGTSTATSHFGGSNVSRTTSDINNNDKADLRNSIAKVGVIQTKGLEVKEKAFLDVLGYAEGTVSDPRSKHNGYDFLYGFKLIPAWSDNYGIGHQGQAMENPPAGSWYNEKANSGAAGRYQILYGTWVGSDNKDFNKENQDIRAKEIYNEVLKGKGLSVKAIETRSDFQKCLDGLAKTWTSIPTHSVSELWIVYLAAKTKYEGNTPNLTSLLNIELDDIQIAFLDNLHPDVKDKYKKFIINFQESTGYYVIPTSGYRNIYEQEHVHDVSGNNLNGGDSLHNYGLAMDLNLAKMDNKKLIVLNQSSSIEQWKNSNIVSHAEKEGLRWGGYFNSKNSVPDKIHFYYNGVNGEIKASVLKDKAREIFTEELREFDGRKISLS